MLVGDEGSSVEGDIVTPLAISYHSSHLDIIWLWKNEDKSVSPRCILRSLKGNIQRAPRVCVISVYFCVNYATDQSDCLLIMISLSDVFKLNRSHEAVGWYL